jgi:eukaryotic-like serine/threonine-protein kinase
MAFSDGNPAEAPSEYDLFEGTPYRTVRRLRAGGMGEVFLVEHRTTRRAVVAKLIHATLAADARLMERLRIEAQSLAQLNHQYIVKILGFEKTRTQRPFLVMEYLEGQTLADELAVSGPPPVLEAVSFACQLLSALGAAHEKGLVHRDIKPDNLFLCSLPDDRRCLKLLDFGVVRVMPGSDAVKPLPHDLRTRSGMVVGTPRYVSPEGALGQRVDARADLYSVALVLYLMLVGRGPFDHFEGMQLLLSAHAAEAPELPSRLSKTPIPPELDRAVLMGLAKNPDDRFQTAAEFQRCLEEVAEHLRKPLGWLETTAFVVSNSGTEPPAPAPPVISIAPRAPAPALDPAFSATMPLSVATASVAPPSVAPRSAVSNADEAAPKVVLSPQPTGSPPQRSTLAVVIIFMAALLVAGLAAVVLVSWLRGGS